MEERTTLDSLSLQSFSKLFFYQRILELTHILSHSSIQSASNQLHVGPSLRSERPQSLSVSLSSSNCLSLSFFFDDKREDSTQSIPNYIKLDSRELKLRQHLVLPPSPSPHSVTNYAVDGGHGTSIQYQQALDKLGNLSDPARPGDMVSKAEMR